MDFPKEPDGRPSDDEKTAVLVESWNSAFLVVPIGLGVVVGRSVGVLADPPRERLLDFGRLRVVEARGSARVCWRLSWAMTP